MRSLTLLAALLACQCSQAKPTPPEPGPPAPAHAGHSVASPSGYAPVTLDPSKHEALGLRTEKVSHRAFERSVRTVGVIRLDETRTAHVHAKVRGFIESIQADFVGRSVKAGAPLCAIYSQGVYAAQLEYVALLEQRPAQSGDPLAADLQQKSWGPLLQAARRRLLLWDVPSAQITRLEKTLAPSRTFTLSAPRSGVVVSKQAFVGNYVEPGTELYVISDLTNLWAVIDLYEADLPYVHLGDSVRLAIEGLEAPMLATVSFLSPTIDEQTRTLKVRLDLDNKDGKLRPGAFTTAEAKLSMGHGLAVPEASVIRTGARSIVFVVHGPHVSPREVTLGPLVGGFYRVDGGVADGDLVATGAQFLIDSESRLRASDAAGGAHVGHSGH